MKWLVLLTVAAAALLTAIDAKQGSDLIIEQARYCDMVQLYQDSNGEQGWPDYNGNAKEVCE